MPIYIGAVDPPTVTVSPGQNFDVLVWVTCTGGSIVAGYIRLYDNNGILVSSIYVTPQCAGAVSYTITGLAPDQAGTYTFTITTESLTGAIWDSQNITVNVQPPQETAIFTIDSVDPPSISQPPNTYFNITVTVSNIGNVQGTVNIVLKDQNGVMQDSSQHTLSPGQQISTFLQGLTPSSQGSYTFTVDAVNVDTGQIDSSYPISVTVTSGPPQFTIVNVSPSPVTVDPGSQFTVSVEISNIGDSTGEVQVVLKNDLGQQQDLKTAIIDPGSTTTVQLTGTAPQSEGQYQYTITLVNSFTGAEDDQYILTVNAQAGATQPDFEITDVDPHVFVGMPNIGFSVTAYIANNTGSTINANVVFVDPNGNTLDQRSVTLYPYSVADVTLNGVTLPTTGSFTYTIEVYDQVGNLLASRVYTVSIHDEP